MAMGAPPMENPPPRPPPPLLSICGSVGGRARVRDGRVSGRARVGTGALARPISRRDSRPRPSKPSRDSALTRAELEGPRPGGATELSPALQRWESEKNRFKSRMGRPILRTSFSGSVLDKERVNSALYTTTPDSDNRQP